MRGLLRRWREARDAREEYVASIEEMRFHIEQEAQRNVRNGMSADAARHAAMKSFGGVERFADAAHDNRPGTRWAEFRMSHLDWKLGMRMLLKNPGVSIIGGITLALAIGLGVTWFELTRMTFYPRLPLDDGDRIVRVEYWNSATQDPEHRTMHEFAQWRDGLATIEHVGAHRTVSRNLVVPGRTPKVVNVAEISASAFTVTRVPPLLGRPLVRADEAADVGVLVIGYDAWQRYFDGDVRVVGQEVQLGKARVTVVGVMPEGYRFPSRHNFWVPLRAQHAEPLNGAPIEVFGRLRLGATLETAGAELAAWGANMAQASPETHARLQLRVLPFAASGEASLRREMFLLNLGAWLLLGLACLNVSALMFARTAMRQNEIIVRNALGASRGRILGQLFTEALVLTTVAAIVGVLGAKAVMTYILDLSGRRFDNPAPFWWEFNIEPISLLYTAALAVAGAAMVGLLPALRATGQHVRAGLAQVGSGGTTMRFGGIWSAIIVLQVATSVICLPFGMVAAFEAFQESGRRAAYPAEAFLTFRPGVELEKFEPADTAAARARVAALLVGLAQRLEAEPEFAGMTYATALPGTWHPLSRIQAQRGSDAPFDVDANTEGDRVRLGQVGANYFRTFDMSIVAGRAIEQRDVDAGNHVVVINESLARNLGGNALGVRVRFPTARDEMPQPWYEVVGVVRNLGLTPTADGEADYMYMPLAAEYAEQVVLHVHGDANAYAPRLRALAMQVDPGVPLHDVRSLRSVIREQDRSMNNATLAGVGIVLLAIVLSAASLYALMSVAVALRTREIGIRIAIGAKPGEVLAALFRRAGTQVALGILAGNTMIFMLLPAIGMEEIRLRLVLPPMTIASIVMLLVGIAACWVPARRALRIQPTEALKEAR